VRLATMSATLMMFAVLVGCDQLTQQKSPAPAAKAKPRPNNMAHRFVLTKLSGGVAFDTQTGQICRTWDWAPGGKPPKPNDNGVVLQQSFGDLAPTCVSLYKEYPSGSVDSQVEAVSEDSN